MVLLKVVMLKWYWWKWLSSKCQISRTLSEVKFPTIRSCIGVFRLHRRDAVPIPCGSSGFPGLPLSLVVLRIPEFPRNSARERCAPPESRKPSIAVYSWYRKTWFGAKVRYFFLQTEFQWPKAYSHRIKLFARTSELLTMSLTDHYYHCTLLSLHIILFIFFVKTKCDNPGKKKIPSSLGDQSQRRNALAAAWIRFVDWLKKKRRKKISRPSETSRSNAPLKLAHWTGRVVADVSNDSPNESPINTRWFR